MPQNQEDKIKELIDKLDKSSTILDIKAILVELNDTQADFSHTHFEKDISNLDRMRYVGEWEKDLDYSVNDIVKYKNNLYICLANNRNKKPTDNVYWEILVKIEKPVVTIVGGGGGGQGAGTTYSAGDGLALVGTVFSNIDKGSSAVSAHEITYNHALFITSETDPIFTAWDKSTGISITESQITDLDKYTQAEVNALLTNKPNWDTAYGWGDHSVEGYLKTLAHTGLSDMPDTLGVNADHDARYIRSGVGTVKDTITKTGNYTLTGEDDIILCNASGGDFTIALPACASHIGRVYTIKSLSTGTVLVDANGAELIDDEQTQELFIYDCLMIVSNGIKWNII